MAKWYGQVVLPITRMDNGLLRPLPGALVTVYNTLANTLSPVTAAGGVDTGAVKRNLFSDKEGVTALANPVTADSQGVVKFYTNSGDLHLLITPPTGSPFGVSFFPHFGPHEGILQGKETTPDSTNVIGDAVIVQDKSGATLLYIDNSSGITTINVKNVATGAIDQAITIDASGAANTQVIQMAYPLLLYGSASNPTGSQDIQFYYNTATNKLMVKSGGVWRGVVLT